MDTKKSRAQYMRNYRRRKRDERNGVLVPVETKGVAKSNKERQQLYRQRQKSKLLEVKQKRVPKSNKECIRLCRQRKKEREALQTINDNGKSTSTISPPTNNSEVRLNLEMIKEEPHSDLEDSHEGTLPVLNMCNIKKEDGNNQDNICFVPVKSENQLNLEMIKEEPHSDLEDSHEGTLLNVSNIKKEDGNKQDICFVSVKSENQPSVEELKVEPDLDGYASSSPAFCDVEKEECVIQDVSTETIEEESHNNSNDETDRNVFVEKTDLSGQNSNGHLLMCDVCKMPFNGKRSFNRHQFLHKNEPFVCVICNKSFIYKASLKTHQLQKSHFVGEPPRRDDPFVCTICNRTFTHKRYLSRHQRYERHFDTQPVPTASDQ